jgi:hypothetical protein
VSCTEDGTARLQPRGDQRLKTRLLATSTRADNRRVWIIRGLAQLALTAAVAFAVSAAIAALLALARGGDFVDSLRITSLSIGALLLLMAAGGSAFSRAVDADVQQTTLGRLPGMPAWTQSRADEPTVSSAAVYAISGLASIGLGLVVG